MNSVDNKVLTLADLVQIPSRTAFLNPQMVKQCREIMTQQSAIEFLPIHIWESYLPEKNGTLTIDKYAFRMYKVMMFGVLRSGEKVTVVLDGVMPFFEIRIPRLESPSTDVNLHNQEFLKTIQNLCAKENYKVKSYDIVSGATIKEYGDTAHFIQLRFSAVGERAKALNYFEQTFETCHDDPTCYYRMLCRDTLTSWTSWVTLQSYKLVKKHKFFATLYTLVVNYQNISPYKSDIFADPYLKNDFTIEANFDIETYDREQKDDIPQPNSDTFEMFKISLGFVTIDGDIVPKDVDPGDAGYQWQKPKGHLIYYDISLALTNPMPNRTVVHCRDMGEMIMAFGIIWKQMQPDYAPNFNGDTYDWRCIAEKARQLNLLEFLERNMSCANLALYRQIEDKKFTNPPAEFTHLSARGKSSWGGYPFWKKYMFKLSSELQVPGACLNYPGYVCIDMMMQLRAAYANPDKYSLHFFLNSLGLADKVDMPYKEMFKAYARNKVLLQRLQPLTDMSWAAVEARAGELDPTDKLWQEIQTSAHDMLRVGEYCIVDSLRCHDLMVKTCYIRDKRQVGALSYTTMDDCVYRANGMKVRNMIIAKAQSRNLHVSNRQPKKIEIGKYPGAYVFPPKKGVATAKPSPKEMRASSDEKYQAWHYMSELDYQRVIEKIRECGVCVDDYANLVGDWPTCFMEWLAVDHHYPIAGLDFSSLYPSLIMAYNLSPEMMVHTLERALELAADNKQIHPINFKFNGRDIKGWSIRSQYPEHQSEIDMLMNTIQNMIRSDDPGGIIEARLSSDLEQALLATGFGLFPSVLKMLFDQRVSLRSELRPINHRKEEIELMSAADFATYEIEYRDIMFRYNYLNSKQKALKIFMNTFYGEAGNPLSPLRVLALAGGVTSSGQYNIKMVAQIVQDLGCRIYYGDTDSVYISMPRAAFATLDREYYSDHMSKRDYFRALVTQSFVEIKTINSRVNNALESDNGTKFLNMAFEEFLYPAIFSSKKKYGGIAHEGAFNENPKKIFVRGFEYVKKGTSEMLKDISLDILWRVLAIDTIDPLMSIVEDKIKQVYTDKSIEFRKFIKTASYKPNKQNIAVHTFHKRMLGLGIAPEPLDRFSYVIVKKYPFKYDVRGRKTALSVGDRMEYADRAGTLGMEIDLDYYMGSGVCGQLARFISYHDKFHVAPRDDSDESYNESELKNIGAAQKYIKMCYEQWSQKHQSKGPALRNLYKKVNTVFHDEFSSTLKVSNLWQFDAQVKPIANRADKNVSQTSYEENQCLFQNIQTAVVKQAAVEAKYEAQHIIEHIKVTDIADWIGKRNVYRSLLADRQTTFRKHMSGLSTTLRAKTAMLRKLFMKRDSILELCIADLQTEVGIDRESFDTLEPILAKIESLDPARLRTQLSQDIKRNVTHQDLIILNEIDNIYIKMLCLHKLVKVTTLVMDELTNFVHYKLGDTTRISQADHLADLDDWMSENLL